MRITAAANEQLGFAHPENAGMGPHLVLPVRRPARARRTATSPAPTRWWCGPARSTARRPEPDARRGWRRCARGALKVGDLYRARSIIGSEFDCRIAAERRSPGRPAIVPVVSGRAWITGRHQHMVDPADPWPAGYRLGDTWPQAHAQESYWEPKT